MATLAAIHLCPTAIHQYVGDIVIRAQVTSSSPHQHSLREVRFDLGTVSATVWPYGTLCMYHLHIAPGAHPCTAP